MCLCTFVCVYVNERERERERRERGSRGAGFEPGPGDVAGRRPPRSRRRRAGGAGSGAEGSREAGAKAAWTGGDVDVVRSTGRTTAGKGGGGSDLGRRGGDLRIPAAPAPRRRGGLTLAQRRRARLPRLPRRSPSHGPVLRSRPWRGRVIGWRRGGRGGGEAPHHHYLRAARRRPAPPGCRAEPMLATPVYNGVAHGTPPAAAASSATHVAPRRRHARRTFSHATPPPPHAAAAPQAAVTRRHWRGGCIWVGRSR